MASAPFAPPAPAVAPAVPLVRLAPPPRWVCVCPWCAAPAAAVLAGSGAASPFCLCLVCGVCAPAPARSRWRLAAPGPALATPARPQLALF